MAILINVDGEVEKKIPEVSFTLENLEKQFNEKIKITDLGVFLTVTANEIKNKQLNSVATLFLRFPVYGKILILSGQELHESTGFVTKDNSKNSGKEQDDGTFILLKETLLSFQLVTGMIKNPQKIKENENYEKDEKTVMFFNPQTIKNKEERTSEDSQFLSEFFQSAHSSLIKNENNDLQNIVVFDGGDYVIKFEKDKIHESLTTMLDYFIENEEYEKSADIRDVIKKQKK
jgi:hypothetical protein